MSKLTVVALSLLVSLAGAAPLSAIDAKTIAYEVATADAMLAKLKAGEAPGGSAHDMAAMCAVDLDIAAKAGVPAATTIVVAGAKLTLAEAAEHCKALDDFAKQSGSRAKLELEQRLVKLGLKGDKLAFVLARHANEDDVYRSGARLIKSDAEYTTASLFFVLGGGGRGELWTLARFEFKGDRAVSSSTQGYRTRPGGSRFQ